METRTPSGEVGHGFIDLYRRGSFVCEAKQSGVELDTDRWDRAMLSAQAQADNYVRSLSESELRGISVDEAVRTDGVVVPMQFHTTTHRVWLDVHHPLVDPMLRPSDVTGAAQLAFQEVVALDAFTLVHDLPEAIRQLQLPDGATP